MTDPRDPTEMDGLLRYLDTIVIVQLWNAVEQRQLHAPSAEQEELLRELKAIRDCLVHDPRPCAHDRESTRRLIRELAQLERGSLGAPSARRVRRRTPASAINEILTRAEGPAQT